MPDRLVAKHPTSIVDLTGSWDTTPVASSSILTYVSDSDFSTAAYTFNFNVKIKFGFTDTAALPAGAVVKAIWGGFAIEREPTTGRCDAVLLLVNPGFSLVQSQTPFFALPPSPFFFQATTPIVTTRPDGSPLQISDWQTGYHVEVQAFPYDGGAPYVLECYLYCQYNSPPTVSTTSPTSAATVTTTARPTLSWSYTDPDGDSQERYRVKVFSGTTAVTNPDSLTSGEAARLVWDSGEVVSNVSSARILPLLLNSTSYIWYVKAADTGSKAYSAWDSDTFTISITPPQVPVLTSVTVVGAYQTLLITEGTAVGPPASSYFEGQRSYDAGTTWENMRASLNAAHTGATQLMIDPDARRSSTVAYRVRAVRYLSGNEPSPASAWSNTVSVSVPSDGYSYLKSSTSLTVLNFKFPVPDGGAASESTEDMGIFDVQGQAEYTVIGGTVRGEVFPLTLFLPDDSAWDTFEALRKSGAALLYQSCYGDATGSNPGLEQFWVRLGPTRSVIRYTTSDQNTAQKRRVTVEAREVPVPL